MPKSLQEALRDMLGNWRPKPAAAAPTKADAKVNAKPQSGQTPLDFASAMQDVVPLAPDNKIPLAPPRAAPTAASPKAHSPKGESGATGGTLPVDPLVAKRPVVADKPPQSPPRVDIRAEPRRPNRCGPRVAVQRPANSVLLQIGPAAGVWSPAPSPTVQLLQLDEAGGARDQLHDGEFSGTRELVMGLDFGTSGTKVVISDRGLHQSFAVPFRDAAGSTAYVLPSTFADRNGRYSLDTRAAGANLQSNLKLALLTTPHDPHAQAQVVAYLAMVIRRARAWLFEARREEYRRTDIVWTLALGQPADHGAAAEMKVLYEKLGQAAWELAGRPGPVDAANTLAAIKSAARAAQGVSDVDVLPMPEIAAQVYGFISSNQFDPGKRNIFLLADVGAGTLDSCLFRVFPDAGGRWSLEVFTSAVKQHGVMNLHGYRIAWWRRGLHATPMGDRLAAALDPIEFPPEQGVRVPDTYSEYLQDVQVQLMGSARSPDVEFYDDYVLRQVQGQTLYHAFSAGVLPREELGHVPFFLAGGGSRMPFYQQLVTTLPKMHGYGWLSAMNRELTLPTELVADGLARSDFDRLSVAYGLSRLDLASAYRALPMPRAPAASAPATPAWRDQFIDKDMV